MTDQIQEELAFRRWHGQGLTAFQRELAVRSVPNKMTWWGYDSIQVDDPDGNELLFPVPE